MKERVRESWEEFERRVMPRGAGALQRQEMRRAYYQGAFAVLGMLARDMTTPDGEALNESDEEIVRDLASEMELFVAELARGRA